jgi:hypothetical protein
VNGGSGDVWAALARLSRPSSPTHQMEVGGGRGRVHVFTGHRHGEVTARDADLGPLEHPVPDSV